MGDAAGGTQVRDVVVVGGGPAGLGAALTLARQRRSVVVVDAGAPRNAPAHAVHGLLGLEGTPPAELLARGRGEVASYGGVLLDGEVVATRRDEDGLLVVVLADGTELRGRRLVVATGLADELPDVEGVRERWGRDVLHCPYCHGWEVRDQRIGVLATGAAAVHQAMLFSQLSDHVVLLAHHVELTAEERGTLARLGVPVVEGVVARLDVVDDALTGVVLADGGRVDLDAVVVGPRMVARTAPFAGLRLRADEHPFGEALAADATGRTAVPGVWVAGNATDLAAQVGASAADGARVAAQVNHDLVLERLAAAPAFDAAFWAEHYEADHDEGRGDVPPNPHLLREVADLHPGTALDAGCGEGAEARWLARQGWRVTAVDVAAEALRRAGERAASEGVDGVDWVEADLEAWAPEASYDLVATHYAHPSMPQLEFYDRVAGWVAPGGTLLVVGHLHHAGHGHGHGDGHGQEPPVHATVRAADVVARLDPEVWEVVTVEEVSRRVPGPDGGRELHDVVVRARRR